MSNHRQEKVTRNVRFGLFEKTTIEVENKRARGVVVDEKNVVDIRFVG